MPAARWSRPFVEPRGLSGALAGRLLARFNDELNRRAVERLMVPEDGHVLEIGFGPGVAVGYLAARATRGLVVGLDPSPVMAEQAARRNGDRIAAGRVEIRIGRAESLPWPDGTFDAVLTLNNVLLWNPRSQGVAESFRVLRPGGKLCVGMHAWAARGQSPAMGDNLTRLGTRLSAELAEAGFVQIVPEIVPLRIGRALLVVASRPAPSC